MPIPAKIHNSYILIKGAASVQGFVPNNTNMQFGEIFQKSVCPTIFTLGSSVMFDLRKSELFSYNGDQYFLLKEADIILIEDEVVNP